MEEVMKFTVVVKNLSMEAVGWFDKVFPPETRAEKMRHWFHIGHSYLIATILQVFHSGQEAWAWFNKAYPPESWAEKMKHCLHIAQSYLIAAMGEAVKFMVQKLKEAPLDLKNSGQEAWAWFDKAYPPEIRAEKLNQCQSYLIAAVALVEEAVKFTVQKLKETPLALKNFGQEAWAWFDEAYPPEIRAEKINQWKHIGQSYIIAAVALVEEATQFIVQKLKEAWALFDEAYPPEIRAHWFLIARPYLLAAVVLLVALQIYRCCGRGGAVKMMKAPGRNMRMSRASFEENPRAYFRGLRTH